MYNSFFFPRGNRCYNYTRRSKALQLSALDKWLGTFRVLSCLARQQCKYFCVIAPCYLLAYPELIAVKGNCSFGVSQVRLETYGWAVNDQRIGDSVEWTDVTVVSTCELAAQIS